MLPVTTLLALVFPDEEVFEQISQKLQSDILECKSRSVEQLQQVQVLGLVQSHDGGNVRGAESSVTAVDDILEIRRRNL